MIYLTLSVFAYKILTAICVGHIRLAGGKKKDEESVEKKERERWFCIQS